MGYSYNELAELLGKPTADAARKAAQRALVRLTRQMNLPGTSLERGRPPMSGKPLRGVSS
jgi:DNA-directed RNA polymerase specialized sigma24 family protein